MSKPKSKNTNANIEIENTIRNLHLKKSEIEELLILKLEPLIRRKCRYYFGYCDDDLLQMGRLRLLELIRNFDTEKQDILFLGYVSKFLSYYFWDLKKRELFQKEKYNLVNINDITENKLIYEETDFYDILLKESLNVLNTEEKAVVEKNIMQNLPLNKLAKEMNKSREQLKYIKKKAIEKLRKSM